MKDLQIETEAGGVLPPDRIFPADLALVFGMNDPGRPALHAAKLWHQGHVRRLLLTGGPNESIGGTEAAVMAETACEAGVPASALLCEPCALHTDQNAEFAARLLLEAEGRLPASLMIVTIHYHLRRARLATRRWFGAGLRLGWSCYPSRHYASEGWQSSPRAQRDIASESRKIRHYYAGIKMFEGVSRHG